MNFGQAILVCLGKYATFSGRATRSEFWWFYLFVNLAIFGSALAANMLVEANPSDPPVTWMALLPVAVDLFILLPLIAVTCRRLHDTGRSGWWQLLGFTGIGIIVLIIWWVRKSQPEDNEYGPSDTGVGRLAETFG